MLPDGPGLTLGHAGMSRGNHTHEMKIGLVGFAGSGKTSVFNTMTGLDVPTAFGGELRLGAVRVPDERIDALSRLFSPKKTTYAEVTFCDVPGEHGSEKKGLSTKALQQIREQDALCLVLRDFVNPALDTDPDPMRDLEAFHLECTFADLELVERRLERMKKEPGPKPELGPFERMKRVLEEGRPLRSVPAAELDREPLRGYGFLTDRPLLVALNRDESRASQPMAADLAQRIAALHGEGLVLSASVEAEIGGLEPADQVAFLQDLGLTESALTRFIRTAYHLLDLISFFTVGPDEVRAWTIRRGMNARQAAGRIHSDLERGFIRAEVIGWQELLEAGSHAEAKKKGVMRVEGKTYEIADGDVINVLFNV